MRNFITNHKKMFSKILVFIFWIFIWQIIHQWIGRDIYVPSPFQVFKTLRHLILMPFFWKSIALSMSRVVTGLVLSLIIGLILGILSAVNPWVHTLINPVMVAIKSTPVLSFIILALLWLSSSKVPVFICFLMCFPIIWTNVVTGIHNVDRSLIEMAKVYKVSFTYTIRKLYLPSLKPYISAAMVTSLGLGWKVGVAAEVLSLPRNAIGTQLHNAKVYLSSEELFAWTFVVILLSLLFEALFRHMIKEKKALIYREELADDLGSEPSQ